MRVLITGNPPALPPQCDEVMRVLITENPPALPQCDEVMRVLSFVDCILVISNDTLMKLFQNDTLTND